ncbi:Protein CBG27789 [Caenorhabditis briggsae]|uniref:Protein CBG27789 n=1 Tax=Caenorhabditis briggsae TaxID=6238 RepID=B6II26_CAEBR|nr:Protein CBG27789 [Caenorhabditis briggsae]CAR99556.1 Protein CBG27789 [Caenorhabditis briggsae]
MKVYSSSSPIPLSFLIFIMSIFRISKIFLWDVTFCICKAKRGNIEREKKASVTSDARHFLFDQKKGPGVFVFVTRTRTSAKGRKKVLVFLDCHPQITERAEQHQQ